MAGLTALQRQILDAFFERRQDFFLTGGAALAGFHLRHRLTHDLDLFTTMESIDEGEATLREVAAGLGADFESLRRSPDFRRFVLRGASESVVVDLVRDAAPQLRDKIRIANVVIDSAEEILANKLCALLSRVEVRDLYDVASLEKAGFDPIAAIDMAHRKDGGVSASQLAWVLSTFPVAADVESLHGIPRPELERYRDSLVRRLTAAAFPPPQA